MPKLVDWMTENPVTVGADTPITACATHLLALRVRHLPVVDERGRLVGLLGDAEVFAHGRVEDGRFRTFPTHARLKAIDAAATAVDLPGDTPVSEALRALLATPRDAIVVVDGDGRPVGLVTEHDCLRHGIPLLTSDPRAGDALPPSLYTVQPSDPIRAAWVMLRFHGFRHLPVVDAHDALVGLVSLRDLEEANAEQDLWRAVEEVMAPPVETASEHESLRVLADRMLRQKIGCIPIVEGGRVRGLVTRTDIQRAILRQLEGAPV